MKQDHKQKSSGKRNMHVKDYSDLITSSRQPHQHLELIMSDFQLTQNDLCFTCKNMSLCLNYHTWDNTWV